MSEGGSSDGLGIIVIFSKKMADVVTAPLRWVYGGVTRDGAIGASLNQGRDELKEALRGMPDAIHVQPVTMSQAENSAEPSHGVHGPPKGQKTKTPSDIARKSKANVHGEHEQDREGGKHRTPSEIAQKPARAEQDHSQSHDHGRGQQQERGRD